MRLFANLCLLALITFGHSVQSHAADLQRITTIDQNEIVGEIVERSGDTITVKIRNGPLVEIPVNTVVDVVEFSTVSEDRILSLSGSTTIGDELALDLAAAFLRSQVGEPSDETIQINVTSDPSFPEYVTVRLASNPNAVFQAVEIRLTGSSNGLAELLEGNTDFAMASRRIKQDEWAVFESAYNVDMRSIGAEHVIGIDAVEIIVHPTNRLASLSRATIADIYSKEIDSWRDFKVRSSGLDSGIENLGRDEGSGTADAFQAIIMADETPAYDRIFDSASVVATSVKETPGALGFVGIGNSAGNTALAIDECGLDYFSDEFLVSSEDHPLSRRLYLYQNPASANVFHQSFIDFVLSEAPHAGQSIVDRHFVGLNLRGADRDVTEWRLAMTGGQPTENPHLRTLYLDKIRDAQRLSATFRFNPGKSDLDSRGERDLRALVQLVERENIPPDQLLIFGFADSVGPADVNVELSASRSRVIADRLRDSGIDIPAENVIGFGEEAPIACNYRPDGSFDKQGASRNRRIEVWIRQEAGLTNEGFDLRKAQL